MMRSKERLVSGAARSWRALTCPGQHAQRPSNPWAARLRAKHDAAGAAGDAAQATAAEASTSGGGGGGGGGGKFWSLVGGAALGSLITTALLNGAGSLSQTSPGQAVTGLQGILARAGLPGGKGPGAAEAKGGSAWRQEEQGTWWEEAGDKLVASAWALGRTFMDASVFGKFGILIVSTLPFAVAAGFAYRRTNPDMTLVQSINKCFAILFRIPPMAAEEKTLAASTVTYTTFVLGFFTFAVLLSVVGESVQRQFEFVRGGKLPVKAQDHLVLLGWNDVTVPLLRHLARPPGAGAGAGAWGGAVAVLADRPKREMDETLREELFSAGYSLDVQTREGLPFKPSALLHVGADRARHVILLQSPAAAAAPSSFAGPPGGFSGGGGGGGAPGGANGFGGAPAAAAVASEALSAAAAMSLATLPARRDQSIVVQVPGDVPSGAEVLSSLAATAGLDALHRRFRALQTPGSLFVSRLTSQAACEPGILACWQEIIDPSPASAQLRTLPPAPLGGVTFGAARRAGGQVVVGVVRAADGSVVMNPRDDVMLADGDRLIALARPGDSDSGVGACAAGGGGNSGGGEGDGAAGAGAAALEDAAAAARARLKRAGRRARRAAYDSPRRILVVGWPQSELELLLEGLLTFSPKGSQVTVVTPDPPPPAAELPRAAAAGGGWLGRWWPGGAGPRCGLRFVRADAPLSGPALEEAGVATCDVIVLGPAASDGPGGQLQGGALSASAGGGEAGEAAVVRDALVLQALLSLQQALLRSGRGAPPHVVSTVAKSSAADLARSFFATLQDQQQQQAAQQQQEQDEGAQQQRPAAGAVQPARPSNAAAAPTAAPPLLSPAFLNFLQPNDVIAALLVQMSAEDHYGALVRELLWSSEGNELYLRSPRAYGIQPGEALSFAEVAECVRLRQQTALGVVRAGGEACQLAPKMDEIVKFQEGDRLVVIAEE